MAEVEIVVFEVARGSSDHEKETMDVKRLPETMKGEAREKR